jgi:hypothetical protein
MSRAAREASTAIRRRTDDRFMTFLVDGKRQFGATIVDVEIRRRSSVPAAVGELQDH